MNSLTIVRKAVKNKKQRENNIYLKLNIENEQAKLGFDQLQTNINFAFFVSKTKIKENYINLFFSKNQDCIDIKQKLRKIINPKCNVK